MKGPFTLTKGIAHLQEKVNDWGTDVDYANDSDLKVYGRAAVSGIVQGLLDWPAIWGMIILVTIAGVTIENKFTKH